MRKLLSATLVAVLTAVTAGCECFECFTQFEACKNQALFGSPSLCGSSSCGAGYQQYGAQQYGTPCDCAGVADCAGMVVRSPIMSNCGPSGCGPSGCGPAGCGVAPGMMMSPGQTMIAPGQYGMPGQVITPGPTVVPGPETYAPAIQ